MMNMCFIKLNLILIKLNCIKIKAIAAIIKQSMTNAVHFPLLQKIMHPFYKKIFSRQ